MNKIKNINFVYSNGKYKKILDSLIDPILLYLDIYTKNKSIDINSINVNFFRESKNRNGVFISHGVGDKNWRNADLVKDYDYIFVSGLLWKNKLIRQGLDKNKIFINGYTKLDPVFQGKYKKQNYDKKVILFAPTHNAIPNVSLQNRFEGYFSLFDKDKYEIINASHPAITDNSPTLQLLVNADIVISDSGSMIYESWISGKQVVFADWLIKDGVKRYFKNSFEDYIYTKQLGLHANNISEMIKLIDFGINQPLDKNIIEFSENILPTSLRGNSGKETANILKELASK